MKILVIQLRQLGDVLMTTPSLSALRFGDPAGKIHFLIQEQCAGVVRGNPCVTRVLPYNGQGFVALARELRRESYDAVIDFQGFPKTALLARLTGARLRIGFARRFRTPFYTHAIDRTEGPLYSAMDKARLLAPLSLRVEDFSLHLPVTSAHAAEAEALGVRFGLASAGRVAAFSPVSRREYKRWPLERYATVCDALHARYGFRFLPLFGPGEGPAVEEVIACSHSTGAFLYPYAPPSFNALLPLLKACAFYFGNDNGIRHVAIAAGLPTATVFGTPDPRAWTPPADSRHRWLWGKDAMDRISTDALLDEIEKLLHENKIV
ncbi:MAG: glycosyltransferase family 9 protein [Fibrobacterota bacterium]